MSDLVIMRDNNIYITSQSLAIGVKHSHETVVRLIRNSSDLPQLSDLKSERSSAFCSAESFRKFARSRSHICRRTMY